MTDANRDPGLGLKWAYNDFTVWLFIYFLICIYFFWLIFRVFTDGHPIQIHPLNMVILIFTLYVPIYFGKVRCLKYANKRQYIWHMLTCKNIVTVSMERCFMKWNLLCRVSECCPFGNHKQLHSISWRVWYSLWQMTPPHDLFQFL